MRLTLATALLALLLAAPAARAEVRSVARADMVPGVVDDVIPVRPPGLRPSGPRLEAGTAAAPARQRYDLTTPWLVPSTWATTMPYAAAIPSLPDSLMGGSYFVAGCVGIAMAQVMRAYRYPASGLGQHSYSQAFDQSAIAALGADTLTVTHSVDFAATSYDWDAMLDDYPDPRPAAYEARQVDAMATLVYHACTAVDTQYGLYGTEGSGASSFAIAPALVDHFGYDRSIRYVTRAYFTDAEWYALIRSELAAGRPVIYCGNMPGTGHAFVVDGYDAGLDVYHVNWGWGGGHNGYYTLQGDTALYIRADRYFNQSQRAIVGIQPDRGGQCRHELWPYAIDFAFAQPTDTVRLGLIETTADDTARYALHGYYANLTVDTIAYVAGLAFVAEGSDAEPVVRLMSDTICLPPLYLDDSAYLDFRVDEVLPPVAATYEVLPVYREVGRDDWAWLPLPVGGLRPRLVVGQASAIAPLRREGEAEAVDVRDLTGRVATGRQRGVTIVRRADGSVHKVIGPCPPAGSSEP